jgi:dienelactone hydrolase
MGLARFGGVWFGRFRSWWSRQWTANRPTKEALDGAIWGTLALAVCAVAIAAGSFRTGFGLAFDASFAVLAAAIIGGGVLLGIVLIVTIARKLPRQATGLIAGSSVIFLFLWGPSTLGFALAVVCALAAGMIGAAVASFVTGAFRKWALSKRILTVLFCAGAIGASGYLVWVFVHEGSTENLTKWRPLVAPLPPVIRAANPAESGPYRVKFLFYGAGNDIRRREYGPSVAIRTGTVDGSAFFDDFQGWKRWVRKKYWGFDLDKLPLNARVWYPDGAGPFPLALIVHGNHNMADFSDPGYAYLGELLASRGFIVASIDENFLNGGLFHDPPNQQPVRGWMLLEHLKLWREWNRTPGNPFTGKVDMDRIALMGHSRGGEAAATAAAFNRMSYDPEDANIRFNYGFRIRAVVAIAPPDGQYKPAGQHRWIEDVSYLTLQGAHDADVSKFMGSRQWDHVRFTHPGPWFKAEIYAYRANHGQFNTVWGRTDAEAPDSWLLNLKPLLAGDDQRRISKTYISAFLETTLHDRREYLPLFEDWRIAREWLPETVYVNRYQDGFYTPLAGFQEDADITTTTAEGGRIRGENLSIWHEGRIPWRSGDREYNGVFLGWNRAKDAPAASYTLTLPDGAAAKWNLDFASTVELSIAALDQDAPLPGKKDDGTTPRKGDRETPDFTIELVSSGGAISTAVVSRFFSIPPPLREKFSKLPMEERLFKKDDWEPVFQTVRIPFVAFEGARSFDPRTLVELRLKFDRTPMSVICVSGIGFGRSSAQEQPDRPEDTARLDRDFVHVLRLKTLAEPRGEF